jgi:D-alanyl-D-alanine carboxypeptidase
VLRQLSRLGASSRHTSGLRDYGALSEYREAVKSSSSTPWTDQQFLAATLPHGLLFAPGEGWAYSNVGYLLLRRVIERATGVSFRRCVEQRLVSQLGLADTFIAETMDDWDCCVPGYGREVRPKGEIVDVRSHYHPDWCAPGVAVSTVEDVTSLYDGLFAGELLDPKGLDQMLRLVRVPGSHPPAITPSYGLGIMADPDGLLGSSYGHGGGGPGYSLSASILPRSAAGRLSIAVFCNSSLGPNAQAGERELLRAVAVAGQSGN